MTEPINNKTEQNHTVCKPYIDLTKNTPAPKNIKKQQTLKANRKRNSVTPIKNTKNANLPVNNHSNILSNNGQMANQSTNQPNGECMKPLKLVLKVGHSGSYSPADAISANQSIHSSSCPDATMLSISCNSTTSNKPPELLPLTVDSFHDHVDFSQINNSLKKQKKKKKKHHHHHHHHHHHEHHHQQDHLQHIIKHNKSNANMIQNDGAESIIMTNSNEQQSFEAIDSCNDSKTNNEQDDEDAIMGSMLINQDSIFSSVDLMDVDSCSKLDISALVPDDEELNDMAAMSNAGESRLSDLLNSVDVDQMNVLHANKKTKQSAPLSNSKYRRLLQNGTCAYDSNNIYEKLKRTNKMIDSLTPTMKKHFQIEDDLSNRFQQFQMSLLERLEQKDVHKLFAWPVIDSLTPGYSQVVRHPMDFHTIRKKIQHNLYGSVAELKYDVRLLCENAIRYYRHSGIHYREASRLWYYAKTRVFARSELAQHVKQFSPLNMAHLGMDVDCSKTTTTTTTTTNTISNRTTLDSLFDQTKCNSSEETCQTRLEPNNCFQKTALSFSRQKKTADAWTTLPFVIYQGGQSDNNETGTNDDKESAITLGHLCGGRLLEGASALSSYHQVDGDRIKPYRYVKDSLAEAFVSHLPYLDSTWSTISHQDSALLFDTFDIFEHGQHQQEIERVENDGTYLHESFVDSLLEIVSKGDYQAPQTNINKHHSQITNQSQDNDYDDDNHSNESIGMEPSLQNRLNESRNLLVELQNVQMQRLSQTSEPIEPCVKENELANKVTTCLVNIIKQCYQPMHLIEPNTIHKHLGIIEQDSDTNTNTANER